MSEAVSEAGLTRLEVRGLEVRPDDSSPAAFGKRLKGIVV